MAISMLLSSLAAAQSTSQQGNATASAVSSVLTRMGPSLCSPDTAASVSALFAANALLRDACLADAGYLLFPFAGYFPSAAESAAACASPSCMDLLSGLVLARLPDCDVDATTSYSPRALGETLLRVRVDLANGRSPPAAGDFEARYQLAKVLNRLQANATLRARVNPSFSVDAAAQALNAVEINPDVVLGADSVIYVQAASTSGSSAEKKTGNHSAGSRDPGKEVGAGSDGAAATATVGPASTIEEQRHDGKLSLSYFFVAFAWLAFNGGYLALMSSSRE